MRDLLPVLRLLGALMVMFGLSMGLPLAVSWFLHDGMWLVWLWSLGGTVLAGTLLWASMERYRRELQPRHGVILVTLVWVFLPLCASVPLQLAYAELGRSLSFTHAYFEAVS